MFLYLDMYVGELDDAVLKEMEAVSRAVDVQVQPTVASDSGTFPKLTDVSEEVGLAGNDKQSSAEITLTLLVKSESDEHVHFSP